MSELIYIACAVCGRRKDLVADDPEEAWRKAEERGWQVYSMAGTNHVEIRCKQHPVQGWSDKGERER